MLIDLVPEGGVVIGNYGPGKVGKTHSFIKMLYKHPKLRAAIFSYDNGLIALRRELNKPDSPLKGRVMAFGPDANAKTTPVWRQFKDDLDMFAGLVDKAVKAGKCDRSDFWASIDTVTDFQLRMLSDARQIVLTQQGAKFGAAEVRDALCQVDYNSNVGIACDALNSLLDLRINVYLTFLEKIEREGGGEKPKYHPAIQGNGVYQYIIGKLDCTIRMVRVGNDRVFKVRASPVEEAGSRIEFDTETISPDLWEVRQHLLGLPDEVVAPAVAAPATGKAA